VSKFAGLYINVPVPQLLTLAQIRHRWLKNEVLDASEQTRLLLSDTDFDRYLAVADKRLIQLRGIQDQAEYLFSPLAVVDHYGLFLCNSSRDKEIRRRLWTQYCDSRPLADLPEALDVSVANVAEEYARLNSTRGLPGVYADWVAACRSLLEVLDAFPRGCWVP
jgi:hypothetical protein